MVFLEEPANLDGPFRSLSRQNHANPKTWSDSYLAAFATVAGLRFVTFDRAFQGKLTPQILRLRPQAIYIAAINSASLSN